MFFRKEGPYLKGYSGFQNVSLCSAERVVKVENSGFRSRGAARVCVRCLRHGLATVCSRACNENTGNKRPGEGHAKKTKK